MKHITGPAHIAVMTNDIEGTAAFYEKLGGEVYDRGTVMKPAGLTNLAMVHFHGYDLELVQPADGACTTTGVVAHFAMMVDDLDAAIEELRGLGVETFKTPEKKVLPELFGGLQNIFFVGPNGEEIELLQKFN